MGRVKVDISMSLDGFIAGPNIRADEPLGDGGMRLHEWIFELASWREMHGESGGERNRDSEVMAETFEGIGAVVMGRGMYSNGTGGWEDDPKADGHWGDEPPFHVPVFVLTHHARDPLPMKGGTTFNFVTDGIEAAVERARTAAGDGDVSVAGGASVIQQGLRAGLIDQIQIHLVPALLGDGVRLFDAGGAGKLELEATRVVESPVVTHLAYRVAK
jgi:dihydrofolate reductase